MSTGTYYVYTCAQAYADRLSSSPRSTCPGNQIAQAMMYIFGATVLSVFNIEKVTINGVVQEPRNEFSSGVLVYVPSSFLLRIKTDFLGPLKGVPSHSGASSSHAPPRPRPSSGHSTFRITKSSMIRQRAQIMKIPYPGRLVGWLVALDRFDPRITIAPFARGHPSMFPL